MNKLKMSLKLKIKIPVTKETKPVTITPSFIEDSRCSINEITDNIFISGYQVAKDFNYLIQNNFTHIINCSCGTSLVQSSPESSQMFSPSTKIKHLSIFLRDDPSADIIHNILQTIDFIENDNLTNNNSQAKSKVLFHCIEGKSRGPALAAGYLMWKKNLTKQEAIDLIASKRKCIDINLGFMIQLEKWEKYLRLDGNELNIFKLSQGIKLLDENELQKENIYENDYLFRYKGRFVLVKKENEEATKSKDNEEVLKFLINIRKYDKYLKKGIKDDNEDNGDKFLLIGKNKIIDFPAFIKEKMIN